MSCLYLTYFNDVKTLKQQPDMKKSLESHPDDNIVLKIGLTSNLEKRKNDHRGEYKELSSYTSLTLIYYTLIPDDLLSKAENDLKLLLSDKFITYGNKTKLISINKNQLESVKKTFELLNSKYNKHGSELDKLITNHQSMIDNLNNEHKNIVTEIKHSYEMKMHEYEMKIQQLVNDNNTEKLLKEQEKMLKEQEKMLRDRDAIMYEERLKEKNDLVAQLLKSFNK